MVDIIWRTFRLDSGSCRVYWLIDRQGQVSGDEHDVINPLGGAADVVCYRVTATELVGHPDGDVLVLFPTAAEMTSTGAISVIVLDVIVKGIEFQTTRAESAQTVLSRLSIKLGRPRRLKQFTIQNAFGARFPAVAATWKVGEVAVTFDSDYSGRIDEGLVQAFTPAARAFVTKQRNSGSLTRM